MQRTGPPSVGGWLVVGREQGKKVFARTYYSALKKSSATGGTHIHTSET